MILDGQITILADEDGVKIELIDNTSFLPFAQVKLNPKQFCQAMSRLAHTPCEKMEVFNLDNVGKNLEHKSFEFEMPDNQYRNKEVAKDILQKICPEGWKPDLYFDSQGSFFVRDDKPYARTRLRRWVEQSEET